MTELDIRERIDARAAEWAARDALSTLSAADQAELAAWLAADRRHPGAYLRAQASCYVLEETVRTGPSVLASNDDCPAPVAGPQRWAAVSWRAVGGGLAVAACAIAALFLGVPTLPAPAPLAANEVALADGSMVMLAKDGAVTAQIDGKRRQITLQRGSATFHVAKDRGRPFIVRSGSVYAEATGTIYSVKRVGAQGGAVRVLEGSVRVWSEGMRAQTVMLHAGDALTLDPAPPRRAAPAAQASTSFWFEETSITDAAERFNQVNTVRIVIADPATGRVPIMGRFESDRPDAFARAAATLTGAHVREDRGMLVIEKP